MPRDDHMSVARTTAHTMKSAATSSPPPMTAIMPKRDQKASLGRSGCRYSRPPAPLSLPSAGGVSPGGTPPPGSRPGMFSEGLDELMRTGYPEGLVPNSGASSMRRDNESGRRVLMVTRQRGNEEEHRNARGETRAQQLDRNLNEMVQELR